MTMPLSAAKSLCTTSEYALVLASRSPQLEKLSPADARQTARRARQLLEKWQDQTRGQGRSRSRATGFGDAPARTARKVELFTEVAQILESRAAQAGTGAKSLAGRTKPSRAKAHRTARAAVRSVLSDHAADLNEQSRSAGIGKSKSAVTARPVAGSVARKKPTRAAAVPAAQRPAKKSTRAKKPVAAPKKDAVTPANAGQRLQPKVSEQRRAIAAAKQAKIAESGIKSRLRGHISARGRRAQGRRDSMNR